MALAIGLAIVAAGCGGASNTTPAAGGGATVVGVAVTPTTASVAVGKTQAFTATVSNDSANKGVTWAVSCATASGCGSLSATTSASGAATTYTAPAAVPNPATVTITATSVADGTKSASATITITAGAAAGVAVSLSQTTSTVLASGTVNFTATVTGDSANKGVTWALAGAGCSAATCGTLSATSSASATAITYTAPTAVPSPATVTLTATSAADATKSAIATITIAAAGSASGVTVTPKAGGLVVGQVITLTATVANDVGGAGVSWASSTGTVTPVTATTATFTAPMSAGSNITVTATSKSNGTKNATATFGVTDLAGVLTYHNNLARDGVNNQEYALTTANVKTQTGSAPTFGKLFSCPVDGALYAQPLWVPQVQIGGGVHNVIVAATMHDSVYVFDADASPCVTYWHESLIPAGEFYGNYADVETKDIYPDIGILGTPVIDPTTQTIYAVTKTTTAATGGTYHQRLHALNLATGAEVANSPVEISAAAITSAGNCEGGTSMAFDPKWQNQRPGLALISGVVYVSWASHGDNMGWHGWVVGYKTADLSVNGIFNSTKNAVSGVTWCRGGIWMSGGAPAADSANNMYLMTGNGAFDGVGSFGDSFLKLSTPALAVADFFTPSNQDSLDENDGDLGSSGTAVLIDQTSGKSLLVGGSKDQIIYVVDSGNMGHFNAGTDMIVQEFMVDGRSFATPGFWNNTLYYFGVNFNAGQVGQAFTFNTNNGLFGTTPSSTTISTFRFMGATPAISASSPTTNGIVWAIETGSRGTNNTAPMPAGPAVLHAFDATNLSNELYASSTVASDQAGNAVKFIVPTVANGKVYIGTRGNDDTEGGGTIFGEVDVYGLLP
jgi:hypothetical protein